MGRTSDAREKLIDAARELMWERGFVDVGVSELCQKAGVKPGSFYYFFPSKTDLTAEALEAHWQHTYENVLQPAAEAENPLDRLTRMLALTGQSYKTLQAETGRSCGCPFGNLSGEMQALEPELQDKLRGMFDRYHTYIEDILRDAQAQGLVELADIPRAARAVTAYIEGVQMLAHVYNDATLLEDLLPDLHRLLGA